MAERQAEVSLRAEKTWPRAVLGNVAGPSSTPFAEEGS